MAVTIGGAVCVWGAGLAWLDRRHGGWNLAPAE